MISRRAFNQGLVALALAGLSRHLLANPGVRVSKRLASDLAYGNLIPDPQGILDLPEGFRYNIISSLSQTMDDGMQVPDRADGMGCFALDDDRVALIRNHELSPPKASDAALNTSNIDIELSYDVHSENLPLPGGTSHVIYNIKTQKLEQQFMSLIGTVRNCSGGITPWNTWLTCEESVLTPANGLGKEHGYVFEVPANATQLVDPKPIKTMGRFNHEAACVDPRTNIVYLTEDRNDSLFYRFIPHDIADIHAGGRLQAMVLIALPQFDTRNWDAANMALHQEYEASWIDLDDVESPQDDLRQRGHAQGAAIFARGEGIHWANDELYFCCTSGGNAKLGQIMRYVPSLAEGRAEEANAPGKISLFVESADKVSFNFGDNVCVAPNNHLIVCEDQYSDTVNNHLKGITPEGDIYDLAAVRWQTEPAGACFSPDGNTLFVNLYSPTATLAITGPWDAFKSA